MVRENSDFEWVRAFRSRWKELVKQGLYLNSYRSGWNLCCGTYIVHKENRIKRKVK